MTGPFTFETSPRLICEDGVSGRLGAIARDLGITHALIVTDPGLVANGVLQDAIRSFAGSGVALTLFSEVEADPPERCIAAAVELARAQHVDGVIGIGGGSSLDTAKLVALLSASSDVLAEIYGVGLARGPRLPLIQCPTTAGTGSEVTPIAIVTTLTEEKKGVVSSVLYPDIAMLDATLTLGLPARVSAMTGIDAMVHAIEAYTSRLRKNVVSDSLAVRAIQLLSSNIRAVLADGTNLPARRAMLQGSMLAGMAFANAPVAAVHALAYPVGSHFHVPHGLSIALVLLPVLEYNVPNANSLYGQLAPHILNAGKPAATSATGRGFIDAVSSLLDELPMERLLREIDVRITDLPMLANDAMKIQRLLVNNPRDVTYDAALAMYRAVL